MQKVQGFVEQGNLVITVGGAPAAQKSQESYPQAQVAVYFAGTLTLAPIFSDNNPSPTPKANPFTAQINGYFFFYAPNGRYDVTFSGGGLLAPLTFGDILLADPASGPTTVTSVTEGPGIDVTPNTGAVVVSNTGVLSVTGLKGLTVLPASGTGNITIDNAWGDLPASLETQYLQRKPNAGPIPIYRFNYLPSYDASDYNFPALTPGGNLIVGSNVITLTPVPLGVNGTDVNHYLYIPGGIGTAEAVRITGGTAVSGAATGTIIVTCANTHSGAWTITSATGGIAEAHQAIVSGTMRGLININTVTVFYQGVYASSSGERVTFVGQGREAYNLISRAQSYVNGDLFHNSVSACWYFHDIGMLNGLPTPGPCAGAGIYVGPGQLIANSVTVINGEFGIRLVGANTSTIDNFAHTNLDYSFQGIAGIQIEELCINIWLTNCVAGAPLNSNVNQVFAGLRILSVDGLWVTNSLFSGGTGIQISALNNYIANMFFIGGGVDGCRQFSVALTSNGQLMVNIRFEGVHIANQSDGSTYGLGPAVYIQASCTGALSLFSFVGGEITTSAAEGVLIEATGIKELSFVGVSIADNNKSNAAGGAGMSFVNGVTGVIVDACTIGNNVAGGHQKYAISAAGSLGAIITGNNLLNNEVDAVNIVGPLTGVLNDNVPLSSDTTQTIAAASAITIGAYSFYVVTGTATIATINGGWPGRVVVFRFNNATPGGVNATGNIYTAKTVVQNGTLSLKYDGAKWMVLNA